MSFPGLSLFRHLWEIGFAACARTRYAQFSQRCLFCLMATLIDGWGTLIHLGRGAREVNPIWIWLIDQIGAFHTMGIRVVIGVVLLSLLLALWQRPLAGVGLNLMVAAFTALTLHHLVWLICLPMIS